MTDSKERFRRWRLILGPYAENGLSGRTKRSKRLLGDEDAQRDRLLNFLYSREHDKRRTGTYEASGKDAPALVTAAQWISGVRKLFPESTVEILQKHAVSRYELTELLTDPDVLENATPSMDLVRILMGFKSVLPRESRQAAEKIIRAVVLDLEKKLAGRVTNTIRGKKRKFVHGGRPVFSNLDWKTTITRNLKHYHVAHDEFVIEKLFFHKRDLDRIPFEIFILVDQSASMLDSLIYSAVLAAIFTRLNTLKCHLILFDHRIADLTEIAKDPVEVLMSAQLGGFTDIGSALNYAASKIGHPRRSMAVVISDFYEGGDYGVLESTARKLIDSGVSLLGLAALDDRGNPDFNRDLARNLTDIGMEIGAMTPDHLADWVADVMNKRG